MDTATLAPGSRIQRGISSFNPPSIRFAKRAARRLQRAYSTLAAGTLKLSAAQEAVACAYGFKSWFALCRQTERSGYTPSAVDEELSQPLLAVRRSEQGVVIQNLLGQAGAASERIIALAQLSSASAEADQAARRAVGSRVSGVDLLPLAQPRPGLSEILLTAVPFSAISPGIPLPGWRHYVVIAAPIDHSALWVRFCDEADIVAVALALVGTIKSLSANALRQVHVPSQVLSVAPSLVNDLVAMGIVRECGRMSIQAGHLRKRLQSTFDRVYTLDEDWEGPPSPQECAELINVPHGIVEIPDGLGRYTGEVDARPWDFGRMLTRLLNKQRAARPPHLRSSARRDEKPRRTEFWTENDGTIKFGGGVRPLPKGAPVYRIRIDLQLNEDEFSDEGRSVNVWRVIEVPSHYDLWDLHVAIQDAMGWGDCHLHEFAFFGTKRSKRPITFGSPDLDKADDPCSANERLSDHVLEFSSGPAGYRYDFGDCWDHRLTMIGTFPSDGGGYPRCIAGERACPPEDAGHASGYFRVLDVIAGGHAGRMAAAEFGMSRREILDWLKSKTNVAWPYRPEVFDPKSVEFDDPQERWDYSYGNVRTDC